MARSWSIAVAQTCPAGGKVEANIVEHIRLAEIAAGEGADLVVFPELSLTGYEIRSANDLAFVQHDARLLPLLEASAALSTTLIVGAPVRLDEELHIGAFILHPDRGVAIYLKQNLGAFPATARSDGEVPPAEGTVFRPGSRDPLVPVGSAYGAIAVCADTNLASHPQNAADRGAGIYLASMFVIPSEFEAEVAKLKAYAARHSMVVALSNYGSPTGGLMSAGRSSIWSPTGKLLVHLDANGPGVGVLTNTTRGWRPRMVMLGGGRPVASAVD